MLGARLEAILRAGEGWRMLEAFVLGGIGAEGFDAVDEVEAAVDRRVGGGGGGFLPGVSSEAGGDVVFDCRVRGLRGIDGGPGLELPFVALDFRVDGGILKFDSDRCAIDGGGAGAGGSSLRSMRSSVSAAELLVFIVPGSVGLRGGKVGLLRISSSASNVFKEAAIAALSSGSSSLANAEVALAFIEPTRPGVEEPDRGPAKEPIEESKKPLVCGVVTSRMKMARTRPGLSATKSR